MGTNCADGLDAGGLLAKPIVGNNEIRRSEADAQKLGRRGGRRRLAAPLRHHIGEGQTAALVVVDDPDRAARDAGKAARCLKRRGRLRHRPRCGRRRDNEDEPGAAARHRAELHPQIKQRRDTANDRQAETEALVAVALGVAGLEKFLEDAVEVFRGDARTGVGDQDADGIAEAAATD